MQSAVRKVASGLRSGLLREVGRRVEATATSSRHRCLTSGAVVRSEEGARDKKACVGFRARGLTTAAPGGGLPPDSHDDFKPKYKPPSEAQTVFETIEQDIKENPVMVYMKGVPAAPQCGFSSMVCSILAEHRVPFASRNVLEDEELRQGIKSFSNWPTIPQVYINGEFVGGCNILIDMHKSGELGNKLKEVKGA